MIPISETVLASRHTWGLEHEPYSEEHFEFCIAFARYVAENYVSGVLEFSVADQAMNELYAYSYHDADRGMPELAWEIFHAFDEGEYRHAGDAPDVEPIEKYTRPQIIEILQSIGRVNV
jgi:hypothetical protein